MLAIRSFYNRSFTPHRLWTYNPATHIDGIQPEWSQDNIPWKKILGQIVTFNYQSCKTLLNCGYRTRLGVSNEQYIDADFHAKGKDLLF